MKNIFAFLEAHEIASLAVFLKVLAYHPHRVRLSGLELFCR